MVRQATEQDIDAIVEMMLRFRSGTKYSHVLPMHRDDARSAILQLASVGRIWVAEIDGHVCGFMAAAIVSSWISASSRIALEHAWWMQPEVRGRPEGIRMLLEFERWAKEQGAQVACMSDIVLEAGSPAGSILQRLGYEVSERTFLKVLPCSTTASDESTTCPHAASGISSSQASDH
jgi:N-acetylglutamate synthase-like GNAT family acetyltransferase